jgi:hypothetical protein
LARVRALVYRHEASRAAFYALAALGTLAVVLPLLGIVIASSRTTAVAVVGIGGLAAMLVLIGAIVIGFVAPRRRWGRDRDLARWVGTRERSVASDLLSSVELTEERDAPPRPGKPSNELVDALVEQTASELETIDPASLLPSREVPRARLFAVGVIVVNIALIAMMPSFMKRGWRHLVASHRGPFDGAQLSNVPLVGDLDATLTFPAYANRENLELKSSSGDFRGLPGTKVKISAHLLVPAQEA